MATQNKTTSNKTQGAKSAKAAKATKATKTGNCSAKAKSTTARNCK